MIQCEIYHSLVQLANFVQLRNRSQEMAAMLVVLIKEPNEKYILFYYHQHGRDDVMYIVITSLQTDLTSSLIVIYITSIVRQY